MKEYIFELANYEDVDHVISLIDARIKWMDEKGIEQWNKRNYLEHYSKSYFEECSLNNQLYVLKNTETGGVVGALTLHTQDNRWEGNDEGHYYIHNLVTSLEVPSIGPLLLNNCEELGRNHRKKSIRLDCKASNEKLNNYYENLGFKYVSMVEDGAYFGNRREKLIY